MFKQLIERERLPHAILLNGRNKLQLENEADQLASSLASGPDLFHYRPEGKLAMHTMDSVLSLKAEAFLPCYLGTKKVFVIHEVERLQPQASHALLKVFEEPPPGVHFILTSLKREKVLPTILSRCQVFWVSGRCEDEHLSEPLQNFLKIKRYQDCRPFFAGIKAITETVDRFEDPVEFQAAAETLWEQLESCHPGKSPFFEEARLKLSRSTSLQTTLESLFIKLGYL